MVKIRSKIVDYVFLECAYNSNAYQFLIHKSSIEDIHPNIIMESRIAILFEDVFSLKKA
jgi:hypothetical protein